LNHAHWLRAWPEQHPFRNIPLAIYSAWSWIASRESRFSSLFFTPLPTLFFTRSV
jgi:hypothetical protein